MVDYRQRLQGLPPVPEPPRMKAAVLVPLYADTEGEVRLVLTKRHGDMRTHPGDMVFPGGRIEAGDEGPVATALREAWEEVALPPETVEVIGGLEPVTTSSLAMIIVPVVAWIDEEPKLHPDPNEVELIITPPIAELLDEDRWRSEDVFGHRLWFYEFPEGVLWGATAFMVKDLLSYLRP